MSATDWRAEFDKAWEVRDFDRMGRILAFVQAWS